MAKVTLDADIVSISGRLSKHSNTVLVSNSRTGKTYRKESPRNPRDPKSPLQQAVRNTFRTKAAIASAWWQANKPKSATDTPTAEWTAMLHLYEAQNKYGNPYTFVRANIKEDMTILFE